MKKAINTSVKMPPELHERVAKLAKSRGQTAHAIMLKAIEIYIDRAEERAAMLQEAKEAHDHYVETGLHLTHEEVSDWIDKVTRGEDAPMPECHT